MPKFLFLKSLIKIPQIPKIFTGHRKTLGNQGLFLNFDIEFLFVPLKFPKNDRFCGKSKNTPVSSHPAPKQAFLFIQTKLLSVYPFRGEPKFAQLYQTTWKLRKGANSPESQGFEIALKGKEFGVAIETCIERLGVFHFGLGEQGVLLLKMKNSPLNAGLQAFGT